MKTLTKVNFCNYNNGYQNCIQLIYILTSIILQGTYIWSEIDLKGIEDHNFPKVYFYGRYKVMFNIKDVKNNLLGFGVVELSLIRPWEIPIWLNFTTFL